MKHRAWNLVYDVWRAILPCSLLSALAARRSEGQVKRGGEAFASEFALTDIQAASSVLINMGPHANASPLLPSVGFIRRRNRWNCPRLAGVMAGALGRPRGRGPGAASILWPNCVVPLRTNRMSLQIKFVHFLF